MNRSTKRFIAGAVCPKCQQMDSTVSYFENEVMVRECTECDFIERLEETEPNDLTQSITIKQL